MTSTQTTPDCDTPKVTRGGAATVYTCPCCGKALLTVRSPVRGWAMTNAAKAALRAHKSEAHS
jgi:ribosomal protein S27E